MLATSHPAQAERRLSELAKSGLDTFVFRGWAQECVDVAVRVRSRKNDRVPAARKEPAPSRIETLCRPYPA